MWAQAVFRGAKGSAGTTVLDEHCTGSSVRVPVYTFRGQGPFLGNSESCAEAIAMT